MKLVRIARNDDSEYKSCDECGKTCLLRIMFDYDEENGGTGLQLCYMCFLKLIKFWKGRNA